MTRSLCKNYTETQAREKKGHVGDVHQGSEFRVHGRDAMVKVKVDQEDGANTKTKCYWERQNKSQGLLSKD